MISLLLNGSGGSCNGNADIFSPKFEYRDTLNRRMSKSHESEEGKVVYNKMEICCCLWVERIFEHRRTTKEFGTIPVVRRMYQ